MVHNGLQVQYTLYVAHWNYGTQQNIVNASIDEASTLNAEEMANREHTAQLAALRVDSLAPLITSNTRNVERYRLDYIEMQMEAPEQRFAPPDYWDFAGLRHERCAGCTNRHSMIRIPCMGGAAGIRELPFPSNWTSPPRSPTRDRDRSAYRIRRAELRPIETAAAKAFRMLRENGEITRRGETTPAANTTRRAATPAPTQAAAQVAASPSATTTGPMRDAAQLPSRRVAATMVPRPDAVVAPARIGHRTLRMHTGAPARTTTLPQQVEEVFEPVHRTLMQKPRLPGVVNWPPPPPRPKYIVRPSRLPTAADFEQQEHPLPLPTMQREAATREQQEVPRASGQFQAKASETLIVPKYVRPSPVTTTSYEPLLPLAEDLRASERGAMQSLLDTT
jgi:hypothetical protein